MNLILAPECARGIVARAISACETGAENGTHTASPHQGRTCLRMSTFACNHDSLLAASLAHFCLCSVCLCVRHVGFFFGKRHISPHARPPASLLRHIMIHAALPATRVFSFAGFYQAVPWRACLSSAELALPHAASQSACAILTARWIHASCSLSLSRPMLHQYSWTVWSVMDRPAPHCTSYIAFCSKRRP